MHLAAKEYLINLRLFTSSLMLAYSPLPYIPAYCISSGTFITRNNNPGRLFFLR